mgnify:CR=1 FL=1
MKIWCKHEWTVTHPAYYQPYVRAVQCQKCGKYADHGVQGEVHILPFHFTPTH